MSDLVSRLRAHRSSNSNSNNSANTTSASTAATTITTTTSTGTSTTNGAVFRLPISNVNSSGSGGQDSEVAPRTTPRRTTIPITSSGSGNNGSPNGRSPQVGHFQNIYLSQNTNPTNTAGTLYYPSFRSSHSHQQHSQQPYHHILQQAILFPSSSSTPSSTGGGATRSHLNILQAHHQALQQQQQLQQQHRNSNNSNNNPSIHPHFRAKVVCNLNCKHCTKIVCRRGMKAILLADANVELYSTDSPPKGVQLVEDDYTTANCRCKIRDLACMTCGNVIGYHVTQPCDTCLESCNNGHFWMFLSESVASQDRFDSMGDRQLLWAQLPLSDNDSDLVQDPYDFGCR